SGQATRPVLAERELLEHAESDPIGPARAHDLLDVDVPGFEIVELLDLVLLGSNRLLAVPAPVPPIGVRVAEPAHTERHQRLELDALLAAVVPQQPERRALRASEPGDPAHAYDGSREVLDRALRRVDAPRRLVVGDELKHR